MNKHKEQDELRSEYTAGFFKNPVRGKYAEKLAQSSNIVVLEPDVAQAFPNGQAVNQALRQVLQFMNQVRVSTT
jgi:hypothetical protein